MVLLCGIEGSSLVYHLHLFLLDVCRFLSPDIILYALRRSLFPLCHDHSSIYIFAIILTYSLNSYPNIFKSIRQMTMSL